MNKGCTFHKKKAKHENPVVIEWCGMVYTNEKLKTDAY